MGLDPIAGDLIMFIRRCRRKLKIIYLDHNGIWVLAKRFHKGGYKQKWSFLDRAEAVEQKPSP